MLKGLETRSNKLNKNILGSGIYKAINVFFSLLIVRFSIQSIGEEQYGIWLTLLAFFTWFSAFEVGISNSLRNAVTLFFAKNKLNQVKDTVQKGYKALLVTYFTLISGLLLLSLFTDFTSFLVPQKGAVESFNTLFQITVVVYFIHFILFFLHNLLLATHNAKATYFITAIQNGVLLLGLIFCSISSYTPSLFLFCLWFSTLPLMVWAVASVYYYSKDFKKFRPFFLQVLDKKTKAFSGLKRDFFLIQICTLVLFSTDNIIIMNFIGSYEVTAYNVTFKYFNLLIILFNLVLLPYWASFTDAYGKGDKQWIVVNIKKLMLFWLGTAVVGLVMLVFASDVLKIWIGKALEVDFLLLLFMFASVLLIAWNSIFAYFLNSVSQTKVQTRLLIIAAIVNVPLSIYLLHGFQVSGIILATCILLLPQAILLPIECNSVLKKMEV
jgi:O-antigen/teichoic acid export membrane protein